MFVCWISCASGYTIQVTTNWNQSKSFFQVCLKILSEVGKLKYFHPLLSFKFVDLNGNANSKETVFKQH